MNKTDYPDPVSKLLTLGDARGQREWPDYQELGIDSEHIPDLIRMALDEDLHLADPGSDEVWAPLHAWRALGQLEAEEAIEPLTELLSRITKYDDDWIGEEVPIVMEMIGPAAIPALADLLADDTYGWRVRSPAANGLCKIAQSYPETRSACISAMEATLSQFQHNSLELNGLIIAYLTDLNAVESAPLIKKAFDADAVDLMVVGDWEDAQIRLGLLDERQTPPPNLRLSPGSGGGVVSQVIEKMPQWEAKQKLKEIGRNDPCWCGSGKKYKYCHMREDQKKARGWRNST